MHLATNYNCTHTQTTRHKQKLPELCVMLTLLEGPQKLGDEKQARGALLLPHRPVAALTEKEVPTPGERHDTDCPEMQANNNEVYISDM